VHKHLIFPTPVTLVGTTVDGKANFMVAAWAGVVNSEPAMVSVSVRPSRYTHRGLFQNQTFSLNIPAVAQLAETDYCGTYSGAKVDKVKVCKFNIFYGKLPTAPLIEQCPVNMECRLLHTLELGSHTMFVGKIEETYVSEDCLTDGSLDFSKSKPLVYSAEPLCKYRALGRVLAKQGNPGKKMAAR